MEFKKLSFLLVLLFLTGYYIPVRVSSPALMTVLAATALVLACSGRGWQAGALLCCAALLFGMRTRPGPSGGALSMPPGVWEMEVETTTTGGAMLREDSHGSMWASGRDLAASCSRGDSIRLIGSSSDGFVDYSAYTVSRSELPHDVLRRKLSGTIMERIRSRVTGSLASALVTGERGMIPRSTRDLFRMTGTSHLLALSGLHVGLVGGAALVFLRLLLGRGRASAFWTIILCGGYVLLSGARASTVRAWVMLTCVLLLWSFSGRRPHLLMVWTLSVLILLVMSGGGILEDPGAQMSFAAALGLILLGMRLRHGTGRWGIAAFHAGLVVTLALAPLVSSVYGGFNPVAPLATAVSIPFMLSLMAAAVLTLILPIGNIGLAAEWIAWSWLSVLRFLRTGQLVFSPWMFWVWVPGLVLLWFLARRRSYVFRFR